MTDLNEKKDVLSAEECSLFKALGDQLIPRWDNLPALSETDATETWLPLAMRVRADLIPGMRRALNTAGTEDFDIARLHAIDAEAFDAFATLASAAYLMVPHVRELIGYPGQEARVISSSSDDLPYLEMLEAVVDRGNLIREP